MKHLALRSIAAGAILSGTMSFAHAAGAEQAGAPSETIHGILADSNGKFDLSVRDESGALRTVRMHNGTVIKPLGLKLAKGMPVTILGHADSSEFSADEIDTPYEIHDQSFTPLYRRGASIGGRSPSS